MLRPRAPSDPSPSSPTGKGHSSKEGRLSTHRALLSALAFSACSITMTLLNKSFMSRFKFAHTNSLIFAQNLIGVAIYQAACAGGAVPREAFAWGPEVRRFAPLTAVYILMLLTSFLSLRHMSIPLITIFKNLTNIGIAFGDWYFYGERMTPGIALSVALMVLAAFMTGKTDFNANLEGYMWMLVNCCATAGNVLLMRQVSKGAVDIGAFTLTYIKNTLSLPVLLAMMVGAGETSRVFQDPLLRSGSFLFGLVVSSLIGFWVGSAAMWCIRCTSPTTYATVGALNKVLLSILGVVIFREVPTVHQVRGRSNRAVQRHVYIEIGRYSYWNLNFEA